MKRVAVAAIVAGAVMVGRAVVWGSEVEKRPVIEAVFVLDTTGSMGGLLEGAKRRIWSLANKLAEGKPSPKIRIGLVAYRDKGDDYVTQVTPLSDDLDAVYEALLKLQPGGGGDGPEDVKSGLHEAVRNAGWKGDKKALKLVFLVGDAPGHLEYEDTPPLKAILADAVKKGIRVNAVQCGSDAAAARQWEEIAALGEGRASSIPHDGGMAAVATPFDRELAAASRKSDGTLLAYGARMKESRGWLDRAASLSAAAPAAAVADRAEYSAKAGGFGGERDLLEALSEGSVELEKLKEDELPAELKGRSDEEKKRVVAERRKEREAARAKVLELTKKRNAWIKANAGTKASDGFEAEVLQAVKEQAKDKGITY